MCASTNDLARDWAADPAAPAPHGALVTADFQTRGRGRRGRRWDAATSESALMSFALRPAVAPPQLWQLGFVASLAVAAAIQNLGLDARLKWPNDVLLTGCKVAGILVEAAPAFVIAGIGINVCQVSFDGDDYTYPPTSLQLASGKPWAVEQVIQAVAAAFGEWDEVFQVEGFGPVLSAWQAHLAVGAAVRRGSEAGMLVGLTANGHAQICLSDGTFAEWATVEA